MKHPYPRYQDSGVEWLGQVPEHWVLCPLKRVLAQNDGGVWGDDPDTTAGTVVLRSTEQTIDGAGRSLILLTENYHHTREMERCLLSVTS